MKSSEPIKKFHSLVCGIRVGCAGIMLEDHI
jgi:hypothetical protein